MQYVPPKWWLPPALPQKSMLLIFNTMKTENIQLYDSGCAIKK